VLQAEADPINQGGNARLALGVAGTQSHQLACGVGDGRRRGMGWMAGGEGRRGRRGGITLKEGGRGCLEIVGLGVSTLAKIVPSIH
jgi:hypothetical protein